MLRYFGYFAIIVSLSSAIGCSAGGQSSNTGGAGGEGGSWSGSSSGASSGSSSGASSSSSSGAGGSGGGSVTMLPACKKACVAVSDCTLGGAAFDDDNYSCTAGACDYTGCNSDGECESTFPNLGYVCRLVVAGYPASCVKGCQVPNDCTIAGAGPAYDADNYACNSGGCTYIGCNSDAECTFNGANSVCKSAVAGGLKACYSSCQLASDCPSPDTGPAFDADNYSCAQGFCEYTGCKTDSECDASFPNQGYVCR
jgi:hypothetical protein